MGELFCVLEIVGVLPTPDVPLVPTVHNEEWYHNLSLFALDYPCMYDCYEGDLDIQHHVNRLQQYPLRHQIGLVTEIMQERMCRYNKHGEVSDYDYYRS